MERLGKAFVIYQGSHGDAGAHRADVILPGAAYTEKDGDLRQHRGPHADDRARRVPAGRSARGLDDPPRAVGRARHSLCRSTRSQQLRAKMYAAHPHLALLDLIVPADGGAIERLAKMAGKLGKERFGRAVDDFYLTNPIARASAIMAEFERAACRPSDKATGTDG